MDKPISVGDLVVVVSGHACSLGKIRSVAGFHAEEGRGLKCVICEHVWYPPAGEPLAISTGGSYYPLINLKRVPPLNELDGHITEEENFVKAIQPE